MPHRPHLPRAQALRRGHPGRWAVVRLTITAATPERARLEAETIAEGGELLECAAVA